MYNLKDELGAVEPGFTKLDTAKLPNAPADMDVADSEFMAMEWEVAL